MSREGSPADEALKEAFLDKYSGGKRCPRKLLGAKSGERTNICSCVHSERNAISNAAEDTRGSWAFCWCGLPCQQCAGALINAGVRRIFTIDWGFDYSPMSRHLFRWAGVNVFTQKEEWYLNERD